MVTNPLESQPIPESLGPFLTAKPLQPLEAAVAEVTRVRAAYMDAARQVRRLRDQTRAVVAADEAAYVAALREDTSVDRTAVKQGAEAHQQTIIAAAGRSSALARALSDAQRDLGRVLRAHRPQLLSAIDAEVASARQAVVQSLDDALAKLAHLDEVRGAKNWANGRKSVAGQFHVDDRRLGSGPQPVGRLLAEVRQVLAEPPPTAATGPAEVDGDDE